MNAVKKIVLCSASFIVFGLVMPQPAVNAQPICDDVTGVCRPGPNPLPPPGPPPSSAPRVCNASGDACSTFLDKYINPFVRFLTAVVGIAAAISLVTAGIRYASSADDPSAVSAAKSRILQTIIGLLAYIFLFAFLNYIIPGGLI